jgi:hypothetical protein
MNNNTSSILGSKTILPDLPDLSHLSENERKIIEAVLERQKLEEEKNYLLSTNTIKNKQQEQKSFDSGGGSSSYDLKDESSKKQQQKIAITQSITDIAQEAKQKYGFDTIDTGDICDICKKTKFVNCNAHVCVYCRLKCCIRCSFRLKTKTKVSFVY